MKFDVIIGNPPYQMDLGLEGGSKFSAKAIYHQFISLAMELKPSYISMIVPSRWMAGVSKGVPKEWVNDMVNNKHLKVIHDFEDYNEIFDNVAVSGGICYFLWDANYNDEKCLYFFHTQRKEVFSRLGKLDNFNTGIVIRNPNMYSIIDKVIKGENQDYHLFPEANFSHLVSSKGIFTKGKLLATNWRDYKKDKDEINNIKYYISELYNGSSFGWVSIDDVKKNIQVINSHKIFISAAYGDPLRYDRVISRPIYGEPGSACSQTYITIGHKKDFTKQQCINIISYMNTKFFRFLVRAKKTTQDAARGVYQFVPLQDFNKSWTDIELYEKYKLTKNEITYIEKTIPGVSKVDIVFKNEIENNSETSPSLKAGGF